MPLAVFDHILANVSLTADKGWLQDGNSAAPG